MHHTHWSTNRVHACDRPQAWSNITTRYFGRLRVSSLNDGPLDASLDAFDVGSLRMYRIDAPAHHVERDSACGDLPTDEFKRLGRSGCDAPLGMNSRQHQH
jgi:hypothetical protein